MKMDEMSNEPALVIGFETDQLFTAAEMGRFLIAVQKDYQRLYGISLVVVSMEIGSWWTKLIEWGLWGISHADEVGEAAEAGSRMLDFGGKIRALIRHRSKQAPEVEFKTPEVLQLLNQAMKYSDKKNANFEIYQEDIYKYHTRKLMVRMTSSEAKGIRKHERARRKKKHKPTLANNALTTYREVLPAPSTTLRADMGDLIKRLTLTGSSDDIAAMIEIIAQTLLASGNIGGLEEIALAMDHAGKYALAEQIRSHIPPRNEGTAHTWD